VTAIAAGASPESLGWESRRLWSLLDMMNFVLKTFVGALGIIDQEIGVFQLRVRTSTALIQVVSDEDKARIQQNLKFVSDVCRRMALQGAENRLERIATAFRIGNCTYIQVVQELDVLKQAIDDDIQYERFYHYPHALGESVLRVQVDWAPTIQSFPSGQVQSEIEAGVDCYALGQPTAAIFHFMRVAEYGLRALAHERGIRLVKNKPVEWAMWSDILKEIEKAKIAIEQKTAGPKKDAALDFYSGALAHFNGFKDQYRNMVMHVRKIYEPWEAEMAMRHVRDFMNKLSTKIGEGTKRPLGWGI
jgi:hypothetical protein